MTNLTEQWKKGELPSGWYWVDFYSVGAVMLEYIPQHNGFGYEEKKFVQEVLAEVPSYDGYMTLVRAYDGVVEENTKFKKQLDHVTRTQAKQFRDNQKLQVKAEHAKDVVNIDTARQIKQQKGLLKELKRYFDANGKYYIEKRILLEINQVLGEE